MNDEPQNETNETNETNEAQEHEGRRRHRSEQRADLGRQDETDAEAIVDQWWNDHVPGSVVAGNTEIYNHMHKAVEDLKRRLARR